MQRDLNKYLDSLSEKELKQEVKKLVKKFDSVKKYYQLELGNDSEKILSEFKAKIKKEYFPSRGYGKASSRESQKVITAFKKISVHQKDLITLMLYRTEMMLDFTLEYGDINDSFYNSLITSFEKSCRLIKKEVLQVYFKEPCQELISKTYPIGWGVGSEMKIIFNDCFAFDLI